MAGLDPAIQSRLPRRSVLLPWMAASEGGHDVKGCGRTGDDNPRTCFCWKQTPKPMSRPGFRRRRPVLEIILHARAAVTKENSRLSAPDFQSILGEFAKPAIA